MGDTESLVSAANPGESFPPRGPGPPAPGAGSKPNRTLPRRSCISLSPSVAAPGPQGGQPWPHRPLPTRHRLAGRGPTSPAPVGQRPRPRFGRPHRARMAESGAGKMEAGAAAAPHSPRPAGLSARLEGEAEHSPRQLLDPPAARRWAAAAPAAAASSGAALLPGRRRERPQRPQLPRRAHRD